MLNKKQKILNQNTEYKNAHYVDIKTKVQNTDNTPLRIHNYPKTEYKNTGYRSTKTRVQNTEDTKMLDCKCVQKPSLLSGSQKARILTFHQAIYNKSKYGKKQDYKNHSSMFVTCCVWP